MYVGHPKRNATALRCDLRTPGVEEGQLHRKRGHGERFAIAEHHRDRREPEWRFELETTVTVERGEAKAHVTDVDDKQVGGEVSPSDPLRIVTQVYPEEAPGSEDEEKVDLQIKVAEGEEIRGLRYEATMIAED